MNNSDAKSYIQINNISSSTIIGATNRTSTSYILTTSSPKGLSTTAIVLIVLGVLIACIVLCALIYCFYRRKKREKPIPTATPIHVAKFDARPPIRPDRPPIRSDRPPIRSDRPPIRSDQPPKPARLHGDAPPRDTRSAQPLVTCMKPLCKEYLRRLNIKEEYFDSEHDKCWCSKCHDSSDSDGKCGNWCKQQHGWVRFGLGISKVHQRQWSVFKEWKTSYYGTSSDRVASIINNRFLPFDGDKLSDNTIFNSGHPDPTHCITSPSLACASQPKFTTRSQFRARDGTNYDVQLVLQCKQKPDTCSIHGDSNSFHKTEWTTKARACALPYGLFVRLQRRQT